MWRNRIDDRCDVFLSSLPAIRTKYPKKQHETVWLFASVTRYSLRLPVQVSATSSVGLSVVMSFSMPQSPGTFQSSPKSSAGCIVRSEPLPQARDFAGQ